MVKSKQAALAIDTIVDLNGNNISSLAGIHEAVLSILLTSAAHILDDDLIDLIPEMIWLRITGC